MKKTGLGRGLDALLPAFDTENDSNEIREVPLHLLDPNPDQPRKIFPADSLNALADSIRSAGLIQPILVMEVNGRYRIIAGERRFRASKIAGLKEVPVIVRSFDRAQQLEIALIENLQREDLNPIEEAEGIRELMLKCGYTQEAAAEKLGMSRPRLANSLRLLALPESIIALIVSGELSAGHARVLCGVNDPAKQKELAETVIAQKLSVRQLETLAARSAPAGSNKKRPTALPLEIKDLEEKLSRHLGMKATITGNDTSGRILIRYHSRDELETLLSLIDK